MAKHKFTVAERHAVYTTHGDRCYLGGEPIDMLSFQVDHIIPEQLLDKPQRLRAVCKELGRPDDFDVNSFENWLPACATCNNDKRARVFDPAPIVLVHLQKAADKASTARAIHDEVVSNRKLANAASTFKKAAEQGILTPETLDELRPLLRNYVTKRPAYSQDQVVRVAPEFGVPLYQILSDNGPINIVKGPFGVGGGPSPYREVPAGWACGVCGGRFFNGAICILCGSPEDD